MAQQVPDKEFKATVDQPAYTDKHPRVLFDEGHFNVHTSQGTYQAFVGLLKSDGYEVSATEKPFDPQILAKYDVLVTSNARGAMQRSEKAAFTEPGVRCGARLGASGRSVAVGGRSLSHGPRSRELGQAIWR